MGVTDVLTRKTGVIVGDDVLELFKYAREKEFAIPAIVRDSPLSSSSLDSGIGSADSPRTSPLRLLLSPPLRPHGMPSRL
jgi:fructose-bisphosphate aldolase, class II